MTSARMKPRSKSVWMTPAHCGAFAAGPERPGPGLLLARGEERAQAEQVVGGVDEPGQRALAQARGASSISAPLVGVELGRLGLELHAHADDLGLAAELGDDRGDDLVDAVEVVLAHVDHGQHRLVGEQELGRSSSRLAAARSLR